MNVPVEIDGKVKTIDLVKALAQAGLTLKSRPGLPPLLTKQEKREAA